jgi:DNA-binding XRE family transcriptional regulator
MKNNLKKLLEKHQIGVERFSKELGLGERSVKQMVDEETSLSLWECILVCDYFNCSLDYLFARTDIPMILSVRNLAKTTQYKGGK